MKVKNVQKSGGWRKNYINSLTLYKHKDKSYLSLLFRF